MVHFLQLLSILPRTWGKTGKNLEGVQLLARPISDSGSVPETNCLGMAIGLLPLLLPGQEAGQEDEYGGGVVEEQVEDAQVAANGSGEEEVKHCWLDPVHVHHCLRGVVEHVLRLPSVRS